MPNQYSLKFDATVDLTKVKAELEALKKKYETLDIKTQTSTSGAKGESGVSKTTKEIEGAERATKSWSRQLTDTAKKVMYFGAVTAGITAATGAVKSMVAQVAELDASLTELKKVSTLDDTGLKNYAKQAGEVGLTVGKTASQMVNAAT